jgi:hypothetical protein
VPKTAPKGAVFCRLFTGTETYSVSFSAWCLTLASGLKRHRRASVLDLALASPSPKKTSQTEPVACPVPVDAHRIWQCGFQYRTFLFESKGTINSIGDKCIGADTFDVTSLQVDADGDMVTLYRPCVSQFSNCDSAAFFHLVLEEFNNVRGALLVPSSFFICIRVSGCTFVRSKLFSRDCLSVTV